jgi:hypothetical protein
MQQWQHAVWREWNDSVDKLLAQRCASAWWRLLASSAAAVTMQQPPQHIFQVDSSSKRITQLSNPPLHTPILPLLPAADSSSVTRSTCPSLTWTAACSVPHCSACRRPARPSVVMFGDSDALVLSLAQRRRERYQEWEAAVEQQVERREGAYRVVVLEIGCGARVPSISNEAMCVHRDINAISSRFGAAPAATLVRINPAPDCPSHVDGSVVGIQGGAQEVRSRHNLFLFCRQSACKSRHTVDSCCRCCSSCSTRCTS